MAKRSTGARFALGDPWDKDLADFCAANWEASATAVMRDALDRFLRERFDKEPELKRRFEEARARRRNQGGENVKVLKGGKEP